MISNPLSSSEVGTLWMTYQEKTLILRMLQYFMEKEEDQKALQIMEELYHGLDRSLKKLTNIFEDEEMPVPIGFSDKDVNLNAPKLFDHHFDMMFVRILKEISMGMYTLHIGMSYREDVIRLYEELTSITQKCYRKTTLYLIEKGILTLPPNMTMPKENEIIHDDSYMDGFPIFGSKRAPNTIEIGYVNHGIETNNIGMQLITGFAQCTSHPKLKKYFTKGKELSKKIIRSLEEILMENDIQINASSGSTVTDSTTPPFSDRLMMYCIYLLNNFGMGSRAFGVAFSLRNDMTVKRAVIAKDVYNYSHEGIKLMMNEGMMEEPPQMEDRNKLIQNR